MISIVDTVTYANQSGITQVPWYDYSFLSPGDRLAIIGGCALFLLLVFFVMVCKLWPGCFLHRYCPLKAKYDKVEKKKVAIVPPADKEGAFLRDVAETLWSSRYRTQSNGKGTKKDSPAPSHEDMFSTSSEPEEPGSLKCEMDYNAETETLTIEYIEIRQLMGLRVPKPCNPCVKIYLDKKKLKTHRRTEIAAQSEFSFHTECVKNTFSPKFEAKFEAFIKQKMLKKYLAHFLIFDCDRYSHMELLGEATVPLKRIQVGEKVYILEEIKEPKQEPTGEVLVSLNYLPTSEKLSCTILKLQNVKMPAEEMHGAVVYFKVSIQFEKKTIVKQRTSAKRAEGCTNFSETLSYDVPIDSLPNVIMILDLLCTMDVEHKSGKDVRIGKVYMGSSCEEAERKHWIEMTQSPRKAVAYWHELK